MSNDTLTHRVMGSQQKINLFADEHKLLSRALARSDFKTSEIILKKLRVEDPLSVETRGFELEYFVRQRKAEEAKETLKLADQLVKAFPASARVLFWAARAAFREKDYEKAAKLLRESHTIAQHHETALWLGKALTNLGKFDEAEPLLSDLAGQNQRGLEELSWLYERKGDLDKAIETLESYLDAYPENEYAKGRLVKLEAKRSEPEELIEELDDLIDLGEEIPENLLPEYLEKLFDAGRKQEAREFVTKLEGSLSPKSAEELGWVAHRHQTYDLVYDLFVIALPRGLNNFKFLTALERAAKESHLVPDLVKVYEEHAIQAGRLHGRIKNLEKWLEKK